MKILIILAALLAIFLIIVALQPGDFRITRSKVIAAPAPVPFALVNDFHEWAKWSPWENVDPTMKRTYEGPTSGVGAQYAWVGKAEVGEGKMTISESKPSERINIDLKFIKPMPGDSPTVFTFEPEGSGTKVTWTMSGKKNFISKGFCMFMSMDKMVGGQFEQGLEKMKAASESVAAPTAPTPQS